MSDTMQTRSSDQESSATDRSPTNVGEIAGGVSEHYIREPAQDLLGLAKEYAREKPDVAACWAFAFGVLVGWKLKP